MHRPADSSSPSARTPPHCPVVRAARPPRAADPGHREDSHTGPASRASGGIRWRRRRTAAGRPARAVSLLEQVRGAGGALGRGRQLRAGAAVAAGAVAAAFGAVDRVGDLGHLLAQVEAVGISLRPRSSLSSRCLRTNVLGFRSSNSKSLNSGPSSDRMSSLALSENSAHLADEAETSWITLGSLSGPKTSTARTTSVTSSSGPMSLNTLQLPHFVHGSCIQMPRYPPTACKREPARSTRRSARGGRGSRSPSAVRRRSGHAGRSASAGHRDGGARILTISSSPLCTRLPSDLGDDVARLEPGLVRRAARVDRRPPSAALPADPRAVARVLHVEGDADHRMGGPAVVDQLLGDPLALVDRDGEPEADGAGLAARPRAAPNRCRRPGSRC